jgi:hypothetical protein
MWSAKLKIHAGKELTRAKIQSTRNAVKSECGNEIGKQSKSKQKMENKSRRRNQKRQTESNHRQYDPKSNASLFPQPLPHNEGQPQVNIAPLVLPRFLAEQRDVNKLAEPGKNAIQTETLVQRSRGLCHWGPIQLFTGTEVLSHVVVDSLRIKTHSEEGLLLPIRRSLGGPDGIGRGRSRLNFEHVKGHAN